MRKIVTAAFISLDGVMQAPGGPQEDTSGGFTLGGWTVPYWDDVSSSAIGESFAADFDLLLGRKTAEEKVASFLFMLARRSMLTGCQHKNTPGMAAFELPLTRADMADYLGLTIETVSRQLTRLKTSNVIRLSTNRLIMVPDLDRLAAAAGQDSHRL